MSEAAERTDSTAAATVETVVGEALPDNFPVGMKVLAVDDDRTCLAVTKQMLKKCRYNVTTCSQAPRALSLLRENKSAFDLILSDVRMPDMDGFKLLELVGLELDLPVIMMSADKSFDIVMKGVRHGACDFLVKPLRMSELQYVWQHVARRKWSNNKEIDHSGSMEDSDCNTPAIFGAENATTANLGPDGSMRSYKKKRDTREDDDGELDNTNPSSSKKPRVVWSFDLHQKFVNAVNQLGFERAVPKRILDLMDAPNLTREHVASHLQKFRSYLKKANEVARQNTALTNSLFRASNAYMGQLGRLDFQIPSQNLAVLPDELIGHSSRSIGKPAVMQPILHQASVQGMFSPYTVEQGLSFCQSQPKGKGVCSFPAWSSTTLGAVSSADSNGGLNTYQKSNMPTTILQQEKLHPFSSDSHNLILRQPSCPLAPAQSSETIQVQQGGFFSIQDSLAASSRPVRNFQAETAIISKNQNSVDLASQSSNSLLAGNNNFFMNQGSIGVCSQPLTGSSVLKNPGFLNQNPIIVPSQALKNFETGRHFFPTIHNSMVVPSQLPSTQSQNNLPNITHNHSLNNGSTAVSYCPLPFQSRSNSLDKGPLLEEGFDNGAVVHSYTLPVIHPSSATLCHDGSTSWQVMSPDENVGLRNGSTHLLTNSCNIQDSTRLSANLPGQRQVKSTGFVGNTNCLPSRFATDNVDSPTNDLSSSSEYIGDDEPCASASSK